jgi:hypothetical protein
MRFLFVLSLAALALFALFALTPAHARANDADALIEQGVEARADGRDADALALFERAYEIDRTPRALAQIGLAEQALGRWASAERHLSEALRDRADPWMDEHRRVLDEALAEIRSHLGELVVDSNLSVAELWVDGRAVALLPMIVPVRLPAGEAAIEVRATGYTTVRRRVVVRAGERSRESVHLVPGGAVGATDGSTGENDVTLSIGLLAGGGVAIAAAIAAAIWWANRQSEVDFCTSASCTNRGELESARNAAIATTLVATAAAATLGILGYLFWPRD